MSSTLEDYCVEYGRLLDRIYSYLLEKLLVGKSKKGGGRGEWFRGEGDG